MRTRRIVAGAATVAALAGGAAGAVAADKDERSTERAVLADAAKRLGVTTHELRDALRAAGAVVHAAGPRDGHHGHRGGPGGPGGFHDAIAEALGITEQQLFDRLRDGQTLAEIAKAEGKTLAQVRSAVRAEAVQRLDEALKDGRITQAQRDEMVEHLDEHLERLGEGFFPGRGGHHGPPPGPRP